MRYAELTGSRTNPLPWQRPWSGGSNCALKLVNWLSRLLTPLKLTLGRMVVAPAPAGVAALGTASVAEKWPDGSLRAPLGNARAGPCVAGGGVLGSSRTTPRVPV